MREGMKGQGGKFRVEKRRTMEKEEKEQKKSE